MNRFVTCIIATVISIFCSKAYALDCTPLEPTPPEDQSIQITGTIDAEVSGILGKLTGAGADLEGAYSEISKNVLSEFPNADKLFMWSKLVYLRCEFIKNSGETDEVKDRQLEKLEDRFFSGPPEEASLLPCGPRDGNCFKDWITQAQKLLNVRSEADKNYCNTISDDQKRSSCMFTAEISNGNRLTACNSSRALINALFDPQDCLKNSIIEGPECDHRKKILQTNAKNALRSCDPNLAERFIKAGFGT
ncbi:hypothetical protein J7413_07740 [Shimia sp. R10_1]|uniref:hypothetical protein n=1 Tax=Shimia sp. R10_1 TaxID=2821095 RepID=UPI001ADBD998|nr:hypothetical protein [Shimia sp. R10_1]MBO9473428.1 hypothetical protein [Shimia sp. R10_1]